MKTFPFPTSITSSMLSDYQSCPRKFFDRYILHLAPEAPSIHLSAGAAFASGLHAARTAFYVEGKRSESDLLEAAFSGLLAGWSLEDPFFDHKKGLPAMMEALEIYIVREFPFATDVIQPAFFGGKPAIEFSFAIELPIANPDTGEPLMYEGRCDMIGNYYDGLFIVDEKTTSYLGETWSNSFRLRGQFFGYCWAAQRHGYPVLGAFIRGIAMQKEIRIAQTVHQYRPFLIERWYDATLETICRMKDDYENHKAGEEVAFPRVFAHACTDFGGCLFADRCASAEPDLVPGFSQLERLYFEK